MPNLEKDRSSASGFLGRPLVAVSLGRVPIRRCNLPRWPVSGSRVWILSRTSLGVRSWWALGAFVVVATVLVARETIASGCDDHTPLRRAYFGDLHVHTGYSHDAATRMGTRTTPDDAYRFAKGGPLALPPYDANDASARSIRLAQPLDFAAVTDHAEATGEVRICSDPHRAGYESWECGMSDAVSFVLRGLLHWLTEWTGSDVFLACGPDGVRCETARNEVWRDTLAAASGHDAPCEFTTFNAYEWSGGLNGGMVHRNVLFAGDAVLSTPVSARQAKHVEDLWLRLEVGCRLDDGCDVVTIPHNNNMSGGRMYGTTMGDGRPLTREVAVRRLRYERLAEIFQHKGSSECYYAPGFGGDELCSFEFLPYATTAQKYVGDYLSSFRDWPENDTRFMREALREGLRQQSRLDLNPFMPGFIASTDTHISAAGGADEGNYGGHHGAQDLSEDGGVVDRLEQGPGGLAVLYAEENTRPALFAAMKRREAYGTSGTRIGLRFFGGASFPADACDRHDLVAQGYEHGVPMGGVLTAESLSSRAPTFLVWATRDPQGEAPLQRVQIIKAWVDAAGTSHEAVVDVATAARPDATVDTASCEPRGEGASQLCARWTDPDFDPRLGAYYYARVIENPTCRWTTRACVASGIRCREGELVPDHLEYCCEEGVAKLVQERAWSSPIWFQPKDVG